MDTPEPPPPPPRKPATRPTHYKVICISMYTRDLEELDAKVDALKARGWTKASKSMLIRLALAQLDVTTLPIPSHDDARTPVASAAPSASPPAPAAGTTALPSTRNLRRTRLRLRRLTRHELMMAKRHPAVASLLRYDL